MAFELPTMPNFNVQPPQVANPLEQYGKVLQMKALMGQQQMLPYQMEQEQEKARQAQIQTTMMQQQQQSQAAMVKAWSDPSITSGVTGTNGNAQQTVGFEPGFDPQALIKKLVSKGVLPQQAIQQASSFLELSKNLSAKTKDDLANYKDAHAALSKILTPIPDMNVQDATQALAVAKQKAGNIPGLDPGDLQMLQQATLEHLPAIINHLGFAQDVVDFHAKQAEAKKAATAATVEQQKVINPQTGMSPEQEAEAAKTVAVETNPEVQAGKEKVARTEALAHAEIQAQMEPIRLQIQQQFGNQKDARDKIETNVLKPFQDKMTDIQMARTAIAQAADNPVAARAAIFKMVGVSQPTGSHRVLPMEFTAFKYPGGITDQIKQKFNDFLTGEPWTPEISQAAQSFIEGQAGAAQRNLNSGIDNTNALYGTSVGTGLKQTAAEGASGQPKKKDFFANFGGQAK